MVSDSESVLLVNKLCLGVVAHILDLFPGGGQICATFLFKILVFTAKVEFEVFQK